MEPFCRELITADTVYSIYAAAAATNTRIRKLGQRINRAVAFSFNSLEITIFKLRRRGKVQRTNYITRYSVAFDTHMKKKHLAPTLLLSQTNNNYNNIIRIADNQLSVKYLLRYV